MDLTRVILINTNTCLTECFSLVHLKALKKGDWYHYTCF